MANKKHRSHAEKAVSATRTKSKKINNTIQNSKKAIKTTQTCKPEDSNDIPVRLISASACFLMFAITLVSYFWPDGVVFKAINNVIDGLIGHTGFIISIPVLLYLFIIQAFSAKRPVKMRTICLISFVFLCGSFAHIQLDPQGLNGTSALLTDLYIGGTEGTTGGLLCGGLAMLIVICFGSASGIIVILAALLTLLGGMQITVPSIIRAIQNRPRPEWATDEAEERQEPATIVVNHIANKRIEYIEKRRKQQVSNHEEQATKSHKPSHTPLQPAEQKKADEIMRQIGSDVEDPVAASGGVVPEVPDHEIIPISAKDNTANTLLNTDEDVFTESMHELPNDEAKVETVTAQDAEESAAEIADEIEQAANIDAPEYCFPPLDLLKNASENTGDGTAEMRENSRRLNETLASFKIEAHIINVTRGPSVTRYEVELEKGVRLSKLTTAADDIALSLGATGVRIAAVPGKISVVGIEVPNRAVTTVSLREVIDSQEFFKAKSKSSFAVGKDIGGNCIVGNISKLPHMLIAGTTGSGKSVCMNSIIISLLYKASPDEVKLIMVDPKMVELGIYNGIPHLLIPVVTDPKKAAGSLQWAVTEMMRRYKAMSDAGVRDLESYNSIIESQEVEGSRLPQIVVIIDELADLMLVAAKEVEESICRIAQMGRAAGIHLIIATQRPSSDVITGLMKANIPSRIAFAVASAMESRIILDTQGAEKLVGKGDMLYAPIGNGKPKRVQGCFVSDSEVEAVANFVKSNFSTNYDQEVMEEIEKKALQTGTKTGTSEAEASSDELAGDEMLPAAVDVIMETGQASVSMLQRRLKLGYARAARIVDEMEEKGIVGPFVGSKPRAILITKEQWGNMKNGQQSQIGFDDIIEESLDINN